MTAHFIQLTDSRTNKLIIVNSNNIQLIYPMDDNKSTEVALIGTTIWVRENTVQIQAKIA